MPQARRCIGFAVLSLGILLAAGTASAQSYPTMEERAGPYFMLSAVGGFSQVDNVDNDGSGPSSAVDDEDDATAGPAVALGWQFASLGGGVQLELEYFWRVRFDFDDARPAMNAPADRGIGVNADVMSHIGLINARYLFDFGGNVHPFLSAGLGVAYHEADGDSTNITDGSKQNDTGTATEFAWTVGAGVQYDITRTWGFGFAYRYIDMGEIDTGEYRNNTLNLTGDYTSHDLLLSMTYRF